MESRLSVDGSLLAHMAFNPYAGYPEFISMAAQRGSHPGTGSRKHANPLDLDAELARYPIHYILWAKANPKVTPELKSGKIHFIS